MHENSVLLFRRHGAPLFAEDSRVREIGPDAQPSMYRQQIRIPVKWHTADLVSERNQQGQRLWGVGQQDDLTFQMASEYEIPAPDGSFDVVLSGQVIEHVRTPWRWIKELARVCVAGGRIITVNPVSWPYHEAPIDCWRIYPDGMRALCSDAGLDVELSICESLEERPRHWYPGRSHNYQRGARGRLLNRGLSIVGWPLPVAFDTLTIARKP